MRKIRSILFLLSFLWVSFAFAADSNKLVMDLTKDGLVLDNVNTKLLQKIFNDYGYTDYIYAKDWKYPPFFLQKMPTDFAGMKDKSLRNRLFIQILAPLALLVNENILLERYELLKIQENHKAQENFSEQEKNLLESYAKKYDVFTRSKGNARYQILLSNLLDKVDAVPSSFLIAVAAAESNWGTAREVALGNALYKQKVWYTDEGIKPLADDDDSYRIKVYPSLTASMEDYALKLNSDVNFEQFRTLRRHRRNHSKPLRGNAMVYNMVNGSPLENYAGLLSYIITFYDLVNIDEAELGSVKTWLADRKK